MVNCVKYENLTSIGKESHFEGMFPKEAVDILRPNWTDVLLDFNYGPGVAFTGKYEGFFEENSHRKKYTPAR